MAYKFLIALALFAAAHAGIVAPGAPVLARTVELEEFDPHPQYKYGYNVQDSLSGDSKGHVEERDGDVVRGEYSLIDADGLKRTVTYVADPINGFNAVVRREPLVIAAPIVNAAPVVAAGAPLIRAGPIVAPAPILRAGPLLGAPAAPLLRSAPIAAPAPILRAGPLLGAPSAPLLRSAPIAAPAPILRAGPLLGAPAAPLLRSAPIAAPAYYSSAPYVAGPSPYALRNF